MTENPSTSFCQSPTHVLRRLGYWRRSLFLLIAVVACFSELAANDTVEDFFETEVRPLLVENCQTCHGPKKQEAGLRLDSQAAMVKGGDTGPSVVPGKPDESLLISAVRHQGELKMPPSGKLSDKQVQSLVKWVSLGAPWPASSAMADDANTKIRRQHWAFQPVTRPVPPSVVNDGWGDTPVDRFILARLESSNLNPSQSADRRSLIRRAATDLTGLPPTREQVDEFVSDPAPDAYPRLIDRLMSSPHYGEQWSRHWLDVARYADTKGYVYAREERFWVHAPAYRDWVVQAFNRDLPYDEFLLWQIAADQAAPHDREAAAAMGFLTLGRRFLGVTHDIIDDRIDVVMRGTMGMTVACARCHDHKYDPIPTSDYYSLYGVFLNSTERMEPIVVEPTAVNDAYAAFDKELQQRQQKLRETTLIKRNEAAERVRNRVTDYLVAQTELSKYPEEGFDQLLALNDIIPTFVRRWEAWLALDARLKDPVFLPWRRFMTFKADEFAVKSAELVNELSTDSISVNPRVRTAMTPAPTSKREVAERYGKLLLDVDREWKESREAAKAAGKPEPTELASPESESLRQVLYQPGSPCLVPNESIVSTEIYFDTGTLTELWKLQNEVDRWLIQSPIAPAYSVSLVDRELIRPSRVFRRGNPANRGSEVTRHFMSVLGASAPIPFTQGSGRFELAKAIIDPSNPLTARIWVNRVWQHHFGAGLVRTASDFGVRADPPSHPELLDWLATRLMSDGWSTKRLHRLMLLSSTYQQRSDGSADVALRARANQSDPENRMLSRMNVRRLSFEEFRDSLLAMTGQLDRRMGGRATDLFAGNGSLHRRRTLYGIVDRQFLPTTLRIFDFANPDLHTPLRSDTTVPQQALFALNHSFMAQMAQELVVRLNHDGLSDPVEKIRKLYRDVYQRDPTSQQIESAISFIQSDPESPTPKPRVESLAWQYGYGELDETAKSLKGFQSLPYFSGSAWQGGTQWPDAALGWVQLTAQGGHPGNDLKHCCIRRWVAPRDGTYAVNSTPIHEVAAGNGIRCWIFSSRSGMLLSNILHNQRLEMNVESVSLQKGDTLDFVVDINGELNNDQYLWAPVIRNISHAAESANGSPVTWNAERDFSPPIQNLLDRWEQFAQVLLISNELMFVD